MRTCPHIFRREEGRGPWREWEGTGGLLLQEDPLLRRLSGGSDKNLLGFREVHGQDFPDGKWSWLRPGDKWRCGGGGGGEGL